MKRSSDVSHLLTAFSTVDREKKQLEAKVVELQVAVSRNSAADVQIGNIFSFIISKTVLNVLLFKKDSDSRIKRLKEENEMAQREINFLNSVIVDMQKKVDDLKVSLEISQATILGKSVTSL